MSYNAEVAREQANKAVETAFPYEYDRVLKEIETHAKLGNTLLHLDYQRWGLALEEKIITALEKDGFKVDQCSSSYNIWW